MQGVLETYSDVRDIVGLVHDTEDNTALRSVLGSKLAPQTGELSVGGTALPNDSAVPL